MWSVIYSGTKHKEVDHVFYQEQPFHSNTSPSVHSKTIVFRYLFETCIVGSVCIYTISLFSLESKTNIFIFGKIFGTFEIFNKLINYTSIYNYFHPPLHHGNKQRKIIFMK